MGLSICEKYQNTFYIGMDLKRGAPYGPTCMRLTLMARPRPPDGVQGNGPTKIELTIILNTPLTLSAYLRTVFLISQQN